MATKSIQRFIISVCSILFTVVALVSCGEDNSSSSDNQGSVSHDGTSMTIDFPVPGYLASSAVIESLQAQATIDGGSPYALDVDPVTNQISGTISGVASGTHELVITYFVSTAGGDVVLCTYATEVTVNPGETTYVTIVDADLDRNIDDDQDGYTNLAEFRIGTDALDAYDVPGGESPYVLCGNETTQSVSSKSFNLSVVVGSAVAGTASSDNHMIIVSFTGYE